MAEKNHNERMLKKKNNMCFKKFEVYTLDGKKCFLKQSDLPLLPQIPFSLLFINFSKWLIFVLLDTIAHELLIVVTLALLIHLWLKWLHLFFCF